MNPLFLKGTKIDSEKVLKNLKSIDGKDLFKLFLNADLYLSDFKNFHLFLLKYMNKYLDRKSEKLAEIDTRNVTGDTALILAAKAGNKEMVQFLLKHGANTSIISGTGQHSPPVHWAVYYGYKDIVELFLQHGTDVNFRNDSGNTALMLATKYGKEEMVQLLLKKNDDANVASGPKKPNTIDIRNNAGDTALMLATKAGKKEMVQLLLEHGADTSIVSGIGQHSPPLHWAAYHSYKDIANLLLQHGANINFRNDAGDTALMLATKAGKKEIILLLQNYRPSN